MNRALMLVLLVGCNVKPSVHIFLFASSTDRQEFITDFFIEPTCRGIVLTSQLESNSIRVHFYGPTTPDNRYSNGFTAPLDRDFSGNTPREAIKQLCSILKEEGGHVE